MNYAKVLPATGGGGLLLGGIVVNQAWLLGLAVSMVLIAAVAIRIGWRHNKRLNEV